MKNIALLFFVICALSACTYEKYEVPEVSALDCVADSTIDTINVTISDNAFNPSSITIATGDFVKWSYTFGSSAHSSTCSGTGGTISAGSTWDSGILLPSSTYKTAISAVGNYTYICSVHGTSMSGTIVVKPRCQ